jgi:hypothetical protein
LKGVLVKKKAAKSPGESSSAPKAEKANKPVATHKPTSSEPSRPDVDEDEKPVAKRRKIIGPGS